MITLEKDGKMMEVCTELQASVFERSGYKRVVRGNGFPINEPEMTGEIETVPVPEAEPAPKKRRRRAAKKTEEE